MNQKGEFPLDSKVSARVTSSTKRLLKKLKQKGHTESDIITFGAMKLSTEPLLLEWEIGELKIQINLKKSELYKLESLYQAKLNRLRLVAPNMIDDDTMNNLLVESAREYAIEVVGSRDDFDVALLENHTAKSSIMSVGEEWGYDPQLFLDEVKKQVELLCRTDVSDS